MQITIDTAALSAAEAESLIALLRVLHPAHQPMATVEPAPTVTVTPTPVPPAAPTVTVTPTPVPPAAPAVTVTPTPHLETGARPDVDAAGYPWDARIHAQGGAKTADGKWRRRRNTQDTLVNQVETDMRARGFGPSAPAQVFGGLPAHTHAAPVPVPPPAVVPVAAPAPTPVPPAAPPVATGQTYDLATVVMPLIQQHQRAGKDPMGALRTAGIANVVELLASADKRKQAYEILSVL